MAKVRAMFEGVFIHVSLWLCSYKQSQITFGFRPPLNKVLRSNNVLRFHRHNIIYFFHLWSLGGFSQLMMISVSPTTQQTTITHTFMMEHLLSGQCSSLAGTTTRQATQTKMHINSTWNYGNWLSNLVENSHLSSNPSGAEPCRCIPFVLDMYHMTMTYFSRSRRSNFKNIHNVIKSVYDSLRVISNLFIYISGIKI
jgi:hypothetical protein